MSQEVTRQRYSMDPKEPTKEEDDITQETKQNNQILSEWEDQFSPMPETKNRSHGRVKRKGSLNRRNRRNRRSSSIFSPASRTSLATDHSDQCNLETNLQHDALTFTSPHSKPAIVSTNLHSKPTGMSSSTKLSEETNSQLTPQANSVPPLASSIDEKRTWDFMAHLGSINSKGAMELSPHSSTPEAKEPVSTVVANLNVNIGKSTKFEEKNPPPYDVKFDTINAVGAALNNDSPHHQLASRKEYSHSDSSLSCCAEAVSTFQSMT